ncbi:hypothetical protein Gohar_027451, partial [Gossypium harknessii]|nr:hypothetical protein [Gossypium harknessii]
IKEHLSPVDFMVRTNSTDSNNSVVRATMKDGDVTTVLMGGVPLITFFDYV